MKNAAEQTKGAEQVDLAIIGGGPAGLAAAVAAREAGCSRVVVLERDMEPGGILNQCIHNGFGLHYFKEELTGPEYAARFIQKARDAGVEIRTDTMVLDLSPERILHTVNPLEGYRTIAAGAVILAMGCRERTRGAIGVPGDRPAGVFTAGSAQRYINMEGCMVGRRAVILGSGDIGLIMARRLTLEGAKVLACVELQPYSGGLQRNITQCLEDFGIPLLLSHTIVDIRGRDRVEGVTVAAVDEHRRPIPGTEVEWECDTVLLSVGLIPENELSRQAGAVMDSRTGGPVVFENRMTSLEGVFACGNVAHVHDLVDFVTRESELAGRGAAAFVQEGGSSGEAYLTVTAGEDIGYTVPQRIRPERLEKAVQLFFRVRRPLRKAALVVEADGRELLRRRKDGMAPGEMEQLSLPAGLLRETLAAGCGEIRIRIEEGGGGDDNR